MWKNTDNKLIRKFVFKDFIEVMGFVNKVAILSEKNNHHPEIQITYNTVTIELTTHDLGYIISDNEFSNYRFHFRGHIINWGVFLD